ncbi:MAG: hypothetical protein A3F18_08140 [Legionellales bacterium RIFCSPHIGHO2_12_FULL_37_14]|nr:MAG: hypothetical protein A3F18_08140 [Legionellales bacterium RIFCSPHIGHO2_12_FULL_37_14]
MLKVLIASILIGLANLSFATPLEEKLLSKEKLNWVFSGMLTGEHNNHYGYYFEIERLAGKVQILSALFDIENKTLIFVEENDANMPNQTDLNWQIGNSYIGLNPQTQRLALGANSSQGKGFGFRIDTLSEPANRAKPQPLRSGLALNVSALGRIAGHVYLGEGKEEFVTAQQTWLRQIDANKLARKNKSHDLTNVLCQFDDGSSFYAIHLPEQDALSGFIAGGKDSKGQNIKMSQFVKITKLPHEWDLAISLPAKHVHFADLLEKHRLIGDIAAGVVTGERPGFCTAGKKKV